MRKTKNYLKKPPNGIEKIYPDFSEERKEERPAGHVSGFFFPKSRYHSIAILCKIIPILKVTFHLTIGVLKYMIILELGEMLVIMICLN